jgi:hypothetical protein
MELTFHLLVERPLKTAYLSHEHDPGGFSSMDVQEERVMFGRVGSKDS